MVSKRPGRAKRTGRARSRRGQAGRWIALALAGAALFVAGLYLGGSDLLAPEPGRAGSEEAEGSAGRGGAGRNLSGDRPPDAAEASDRTEATSEPPITEPEPGHAGPAEPPLLEPVDGPPPPGGGALLALVIDDLGRSVADLDRIRALGVPVTYAVLPFESRTGEVAAELERRGEEVIVHLPMEPSNGANPGPGALTAAMSRRELAAGTRRALGAVPGAVGVNNHMGSRLSAEPPAMEAVLRVIGGRSLYWLDSRTSADSVAYGTARSLGIPAAERQVFLDPDPRADAVRLQFRRLLLLARERGAAIAIGHPHPETLAVLEEEIPAAVERGYRFVPVSFLLDRSAVAAR